MTSNKLTSNNNKCEESLYIFLWIDITALLKAFYQFYIFPFDPGNAALNLYSFKVATQRTCCLRRSPIQISSTPSVEIPS